MGKTRQRLSLPASPGRVQSKGEREKKDKSVKDEEQ
jgi:hypothetical protein